MRRQHWSVCIFFFLWMFSNFGLYSTGWLTGVSFCLPLPTGWKRVRQSLGLLFEGFFWMDLSCHCLYLCFSISSDWSYFNYRWCAMSPSDLEARQLLEIITQPTPPTGPQEWLQITSIWSLQLRATQAMHISRNNQSNNAVENGTIYIGFHPVAQLHVVLHCNIRCTMH